VPESWGFHLGDAFLTKFPGAPGGHALDQVQKVREAQKWYGSPLSRITANVVELVLCAPPRAKMFCFFSFLSAKFLSLLYIWSNTRQFSAFHCNKPKLVCKTVIVHSFGRKYGSVRVYTTCPIKRKTIMVRFSKSVTVKLGSKFAIQLSLKSPPHLTRNIFERSHMDRPNGLLQIEISI